jgi:hypothetical protein
MGVAQNIYAGAAIIAEGTMVSISKTTGSLLTKGGMGVAGKAYVGNMMVVEGTQAAVDSISGSMITAGGIGAAKSLYTAGQLVASIDDAVTNAVTDVLVLKHSTNDENGPSNGIGVGISIGIEDAGGLAEAAKLDWTLSRATSTQEDSDFEVKLMFGGTMTSSLKATASLLTLNGGLKMSSGTVTQSTNLQTGVTVNKYSGVITTATGTTVAGGCEGFPFSNSKIETTSIVQVSIMSYSGTYGTNGIPTVAISATGEGSATIQICNGGSGNLNGVLKIAFLVLK